MLLNKKGNKMKYQKNITLYDTKNDVDICLTKYGKLYLIKDGEKKRINTIKVIKRKGN